MKAHVVLAHPELKSFNGQLAHLTVQGLEQQGYSVTQSDLYRMGFDPCERAEHFTNRSSDEVFHAQTEQRYNAGEGTLPADVQAEIDNILACDLLVVHFPLWWFGPPAILKGWMDRVFAYGKMYKSLERYDRGICSGKKMIASVTTGASEASCSYNGREGDTMMHLWPVLFPFRYLGFHVHQPEVFHGVGGVSFIEGHDGANSIIDSYEKRWKGTISSLDDRTFVAYNSDTDFDETNRLLKDAPDYSPFVRQIK